LPKGSYAIATKIHHAAVDGSSIMTFFNALADIDNKGTPAVPLNTAKLCRSPEPSLLDMGFRAAWHTIRSPIGMIDGVMRSAPNLYRVAQNALSSRSEEKYRVPDTQFNCSATPHKAFDATAFPLADLKTMRKAVSDCTINDVVLAVCGGALRKYLQHHDELPEDSLIAWVPINSRLKGMTIQDRPGNEIKSMTVPIFSNIEDPIERLQCVQQATQSSKAAKSGVSARLMTDLSQHVPAATQVAVGRLVLRAGLAARMCNLFISNVPGPQETLYMNGARQVATYGMAPLTDGMGLFIATPSYNGKITFCVTSTRDALPDIRFFVTCIEKAMAELKRAAKPVKRRDAG
jgi:WS/DGAT/MGAT family acyltransferase